MKAFAAAEFRDRAALGIAGRDFRKGLQVAAHEIQIQVGPQGAHSFLIQQYAALEEGGLGAMQHNPGVHEFGALGAGHDAKRGVIKRA